MKGVVRDLYTTNCHQHVRSSGQGAIVCKSRAAHRALITCNMSCSTLYGWTAQLLSLTELKSHLLELYPFGRSINRCCQSCQTLDAVGSVLRLVGPVSVYCDWVRKQVWSASAISARQTVTADTSLRYTLSAARRESNQFLSQHVKLSQQPRL